MAPQPSGLTLPHQPFQRPGGGAERRGPRDPVTGRRGRASRGRCRCSAGPRWGGAAATCGVTDCSALLMPSEPRTLGAVPFHMQMHLYPRAEVTVQSHLLTRQTSLEHHLYARHWSAGLSSQGWGSLSEEGGGCSPPFSCLFKNLVYLSGYAESEWQHAGSVFVAACRIFAVAGKLLVTAFQLIP